jgi:hypothetical protein
MARCAPSMPRDASLPPVICDTLRPWAGKTLDRALQAGMMHQHLITCAGMFGDFQGASPVPNRYGARSSAESRSGNGTVGLLKKCVIGFPQKRDASLSLSMTCCTRAVIPSGARNLTFSTAPLSLITLKPEFRLEFRSSDRSSGDSLLNCARAPVEINMVSPELGKKTNQRSEFTLCAYV